MTDGKNTDGLKAAARHKAAQARQRVEKAIRQMHKAGEPINISAVATHAQVSRTYLQQHPEFRDRIRLLGRKAPAPVPEPPTGSNNAIIAALRNQLSAETERHQEELKELRGEIRRLKAALAETHGHLITQRPS